VGRVELRAFHKGGGIHIEIEDDGRGLNREAILAKALERGLIRESDNLSDKEVYDLIFQPGFSTAKEITDVSGRGVGMDVVKRNIDALRGRVEVRTEQGQGTVISVRLPLTLAIIDGMVVGIGSERYVIPTLSIVRSIRPQAENISTVAGRGELLNLDGALLPIFRLGRIFENEAAERDLTEGLVVVAENDGRQVGLAVDTLLGQQQIVIKPLGEGLRHGQGIVGGAVMPDGEVGLILDVAGLISMACSEEAALEGAGR
jgi:two-component system chemotaxis sensor kinase CheA